MLNFVANKAVGAGVVIFFQNTRGTSKRNTLEVRGFKCQVWVVPMGLKESGINKVGGWYKGVY